MLSFLQTHPFPVQAYFERSLVLTFAFPKARVQALLPAYLTLDTWHDQWPGADRYAAGPPGVSGAGRVLVGSATDPVRLVLGGTVAREGFRDGDARCVLAAVAVFERRVLGGVCSWVQLNGIRRLAGSWWLSR